MSRTWPPRRSRAPCPKLLRRQCKMPEIFILIPGPLQTRTGGYEYDRRMIAGLRERRWAVGVRELDGSFPYPTPAAREDAVCQLASIPSGTTVLIDALALGSLPAEVAREASRLKIVAL